jgi:hypothetical protein
MLHADLGKLSNPVNRREAPARIALTLLRLHGVRADRMRSGGPEIAARPSGMTLRYALPAGPLCICMGCHAREDRVGKRC